MSVILCTPEERWEAKDGAPQGPAFDITIPSSRRGRGPYRIARDNVTGLVVHIPRCESWVHRGPTACRHVADACHRAEQPAVEFLRRVGVARVASTWAFHMPNLPEPVQDFLREVVTALDEAQAQIARNEEGARARAESDAFRALPAEEQEALAVADWGERPGGRS